MGRKVCGGQFQPNGFAQSVFSAPSELACDVDPVLTARLSPCLLPASACRVHPEAKDVVDMQWKPLPEVIRMLARNTKPPPFSRDHWAARSAKPAARKKSEAALRSLMSRAATLHFVACNLRQPSRGSNVLGWLERRWLGTRTCRSSTNHCCVCTGKEGRCPAAYGL